MGGHLIQVRTFNWPRIGRALMVLAVGALLIAGALKLADVGGGPRQAGVSAAESRCRSLGLAAEQDAACGALWSADRTHFRQSSAADRRSAPERP